MPGPYYGKYTGIVKDNRDDNNLGQVKVCVPAIFPEDELMVARPALPYGYFFVPEDGAKVWVEFEGGEPGLPLWTGVQYVSGEWPDEAKASPPQLRVIKTAVGHLIIFDDKSGQESIQIKDGANGHTITLDQNGIQIKDGANSREVVLNAQGIEVKDGANQNDLKMSSSGITISRATVAKVELATGMITITAGPGLVKLGAGALPVIRVGDMGVGNLGAPVPITVTTNTQVMA